MTKRDKFAKASHQSTDAASEPAAASRRRIADISDLFEEIRALVAQSITDQEPISASSTRKALAKLSELQTAHLMVLQAQEKFHDQFEEDDGGGGLDYDKVRSDIGRALDRIRAASDAGGVSKGPDKG